MNFKYIPTIKKDIYEWKTKKSKNQSKRPRKRQSEKKQINRQKKGNKETKK